MYEVIKKLIKSLREEREKLGKMNEFECRHKYWDKQRLIKEYEESIEVLETWIRFKNVINKS